MNNKTVLVTGAARGIGRAIALELATAGADIVGVDLRISDLNDTAREVAARGRTFKEFACDITDEAAATRLMDEVFSKNGGFDVLLNNAGVLPSGPYLEQDFYVWRRAVEVNLLGLMHLTYLALPHLQKRGQAHIVNIASIAGKFGTEGVAAYAASKHGVVGFSSALRSELEGTSVGVSWICPSQARTRMSEGVSQTWLTPIVEPIQVARAVRKAIERGSIEVFVPGWLRLTTSLLPALLPRVARWILRFFKASRGWTLAKKEIEDGKVD